jgi:hypothetical protein
MSGRPPGERRTGRRWPGRNCAWLAAARLRHGFDVRVLNIGPGGALVEGTARLLPGATVELQLMGADWSWTTCARVLRCRVSGLLDRGVRYRAALQFDRRLEVAGCGPSESR